MTLEHTSKGGSGAINGPLATGMEPAAIQSPPQYNKWGEEEDAAGEEGKVKDKEEGRGSEQGLEGVPGHFMEPLSCCCCRCWHVTAEGGTREGGGGGSRLPPACWP